jgi:PTH1 family peptidyl-tRNA hydrolase
LQNAKKDLIIVGLGNPGPRYRETLHNVGFKVVEKLADKLGLRWKFEQRFQAEVTRGNYLSTTFHLLRPETFMNLSGEAVKEYMLYFRMSATQVIVIADDADLEFGEVRLKPSGGSGGHNGLKSLEKELLTQEFKRLRFGIGRPKIVNMSLADYVLMSQETAVWDLLKPSIEKAVTLLMRLAKEPFDSVMKDANTREKFPGGSKKIDGEINEIRT